MARIELDLDLFARQLKAKAVGLKSPRQRQMVEVFSEHTKAEIDGDLDRLMATMNPNPAFHIWTGGGDVGPKGWDAIKAMYVHMFASRSNYMEINYQRIIVDDEALFTEFTQRKILPGQNFVSGPWADALRAKGETADPAAHYLSEGRVVIIVPFDDQCRMIGEDGFAGAAPAIRKLSDQELPEGYRARL
jgi:hypothetical protein